MSKIKLDFILDGGANMAFIKRAITDVLHNRVSNSKVLLLTGPRQVGKSTLLKHEYDNYHYE